MKRCMLVCVLLLGLLAFPALAQDGNVTDGCVQQYDPQVDYFPDKSAPDYATGFSIEYHNNFKVVTVLTPWPDATETFQYVLVQCGTPAPDSYPDAQVIDVPVNRFIAMSTTYLPYVDSLGLVDRLVGVDNGALINTPGVAAKFAAGDLVEVGYGADVNVEVALNAEPDVVFAYGSGYADSDAHPVLLAAGLHVALDGEFNETSPLAQAEWIKYIAAFFNKEADANQIFDDVAGEYNRLKELAAGAETRPTVFVNAPFQGTWYMAGGAGVTAHYLADAGADYLWSDDESTGSLFLDFEAVFDKAAEADFWVNADQTWFAKADILAADERYAGFKAVQDGNVWSYNKRVNANFGNDFFEGGVANPQLVLGDLIAIFHPDLLPDHAFVYYQPVGGE